jgi:Protein of unknown function (DUF1236)
MKKSLFSIVTASVLLAGTGVVSAQSTSTTTSTTTWTPDEGAAISSYSTTQKYASFSDPTLTPTVGMALPPNVSVYPLPPTVVVQSPDRYSYGIVNNHNVIVDRSTRQVVHAW